MSWPCKLLDIIGTKEIKITPTPESPICGKTVLVARDGTEYDFDELPIGSMFYVPKELAETKGWPWYWAREQRLSDFYKANNAHRPPLLVKLPGRNLFCIDGKCWNEGGAYGGWQVSGEAPNITVQPSINIGGSYHGWLTNGVVSDDCEGRKFNDKGIKV